MKYAQLVTGLLIGTALGGIVVTTSGHGVGGVSKSQVQTIVKDMVAEDPSFILDALQKFQQGQQTKQTEAAGKALQDKDVHEGLYDTPHTAFVGPENAKKVVVEFFDYSCPACKMMFKAIDQATHEDKDLKVIFKEMPIFGAVSDHNSAIGLAIWKLYPDRYYEFHTKMMAGPGHADQKVTYDVLKKMGLDKAEIEAEAKKPEYAKMVEDNRKLAEKLNIRGTPAIIFKDHVVPGAMDYDGFKKDLDKE